MADLRNLNEMMERIQGIAVQTSQGSFVKVEDLMTLIEEYQGEGSLRQTGEFKSFNEAKQAAMRDPELMDAFQSKRRVKSWDEELRTGTPTATEA